MDHCAQCGEVTCRGRLIELSGRAPVGEKRTSREAFPLCGCNLSLANALSERCSLYGFFLLVIHQRSPCDGLRANGARCAREARPVRAERAAAGTGHGRMDKDHGESVLYGRG